MDFMLGAATYVMSIDLKCDFVVPRMARTRAPETQRTMLLLFDCYLTDALALIRENMV